MVQNVERVDAVLTAAPVVPVLIIEDAKKAVPMAKALVAGGLPAIEITLRTDAAMEAIRAVASEVEGAMVGAGTVLNAEQYDKAAKAGSTFIVSPGATANLLHVADGHNVPLLPGATSASESMFLLEHGYVRQKFFPAEPAGGVPFVKALSSPLSAIKFCPTGGITAQNAPDYLKLPNVICVGGSWIASPDLINAEAWDQIEANARAACALS
ncbi:MAG: bifunctional 4-hydroxy-2-oxoglutarate aldolase/2-dehydro-3-deoxy-phosphogluconate aldolase [Stappiaceae bacterium]